VPYLLGDNPVRPVGYFRKISFRHFAKFSSLQHAIGKGFLLYTKLDLTITVELQSVKKLEMGAEKDEVKV